MNRLRDDVGDDPVAVRGIALLRAYAATPADNETKRRVWAAIQQNRLRAVAPQPLRRLRWVAACVVVLGLAGTAGAMITQRWILPERDRSVEPARERVEATRRVRTPTHGMRPAPEGASATGAVSSVSSGGAALAGAAMAPVAATESVPTQPVPTPSRSAAPLASSRTRAVPRAAVAASRAARAAADRAALGTGAGDALPQSPAVVRERTQVLDALIALRRDHDGSRAGMLLDEYLAGFPHGVLREEALVLAIEAADARGDGASARRLARSYEAAYPSGRFSAFARRRAVAGSP